MLERFFTAPKTLRRLRSGLSGAYIDGFAGELEANGYGYSTAIRYLRAAAHLGQFLHLQGRTLADIDPSTASAFYGHFATCRCPLSNGGGRNHHPYFGARLFQAYLEQIGVCRGVTSDVGVSEPELLADFRRWLQKHRGAAEATIRGYSRGAGELLAALGEDPAQWRVQDIRAYFVRRAGQCNRVTLEKLATSLRSFLRYLSVQGRCQADLDLGVPAIASWRLAELPRYLTAEQLERVIAACDGDAPRRRRDRAIILLLARLGLRAGDVARLRFGDIEGETGTLRVSGKGRYQVRLPLPQEVGEAILLYIDCRPKIRDDDYVFGRNIAPFRPFVRGDGVSTVAARAMKRAGVETPLKGAHALRHTAATQMLRQGVPLDQIASVLRHRGVDTTAYYAKADIDFLKQIAPAWPEVLS